MNAKLNILTIKLLHKLNILVAILDIMIILFIIK